MLSLLRENMFFRKKTKKRVREKKKEIVEAEKPKYDDRKLRKDILRYFSRTKDVWISYTRLENNFRNDNYTDEDRQMVIPVINELEGKRYLETDMKEKTRSFFDERRKKVKYRYHVRHYRLRRRS